MQQGFDSLDNISESKPLSWDPRLRSNEIDKIYSGEFLINLNCIKCKSHNITTFYTDIYKIYCTFDKIERLYYKNKCIACENSWYDIDISYCIICNGAMINFDSNLNRCICIDKPKRTREKKHIIYANNIIHNKIELESIDEQQREIVIYSEKNNKIHHNELVKSEFQIFIRKYCCF